ncbi:MAG: helix-turn-helix domain-containing protein [Rhizobium sp.]|uniref:winged helix-turn-helix transcriptional regulator n=1 Tax=Rhizobium sp. TaxID=391 RepID=UPI00055CF907
MVTNLDDGTFDFCETLSDPQDALAREMLERASAKWPLRVMHILAKAKGPLRFSRVLEGVEGISQKVLTQTLRTLESDGLVTRTLYPQVPPRVEYELTPLGGELLVEVVALWQWIANRLPDFEAARAQSPRATDAAKS